MRLPRLLTALCLALLLARTTAAQDKEPTYRGRTANEWAVRLKSRDEEVSDRAVLALEIMGPNAKQAVPALLSTLRLLGGNQQAQETARKAAQGLAKIGPAAVPSLIAFLKEQKANLDHPDLMKRNPFSGAVGVLEQIGPEARDAVPELIAVLKMPGNHRFRIQQALVKIGSASAAALAETLNDKDDNVRLTAARVLRKIGPGAKIAVPALIKALKDKSGGVRGLAVETLAAIGAEAKDAVPALSAFLKKEPKANERRLVAQALLHIDPGQQEALAVLLDALKDKEASVRQLAILALVRSPAKEVVPALTDALKDKEKEVRAHAAGALWNFGARAKAAVPTLRAALKDTEDHVRRTVARTLLRIDAGEREALAVLLDTLKDKDAQVREFGATALGEVGPPAREAVPALTAVLRDKEGHVSAVAAWALRQIDLPALLEQLKDKDAQVRRRAAEALRKVDPKEKTAVAALRAAGQDKDKQVRTAAVMALVDLARGNQTLAPALASLLKNKETRGVTVDCLVMAYFNFGSPVVWKEGPKEQSRIVRMFRELGPEALPALLEALKAGEIYREVALEFLGRVDEEGKSVAVLLAIIKDRKDGHRHLAARALAWIGPAAREAVPTLLDVLKNDPPNSGTRPQAAKALAEIGPVSPEIVPALAEVWKNSGTREAAVVGLAMLGKAGVPPLIGVVKNDPDWVNRCEAAQALGEIGPVSKEVLPALIAVLKDKDKLVRLAVIQALANMGPDAREAVPALLQAMKGNFFEVGAALLRIDPAAALKAGFK